MDNIIVEVASSIDQAEDGDEVNQWLTDANEIIDGKIVKGTKRKYTSMMKMWKAFVKTNNPESTTSKMRRLYCKTLLRMRINHFLATRSRSDSEMAQ